MAATGLSADPKEYRARLDEQSDDQIDAWAAELMRDVAIRRGVIKVVDDFRKAVDWTSVVSNGCSLLAVAPPASIGRDRDGPPDGPGDHPVRARAGHPRPGPRRARSGSSTTSSRTSTSSSTSDAHRRRRSHPAGGHPVPSLPSTPAGPWSAVALVAGADAAVAVRLGAGDDGLQVSIGALNDLRRRAARRRPQAAQADPGRARVAGRRPGRRRGGRGRGPRARGPVRARHACSSPWSSWRSGTATTWPQGDGVVVAAVRGRDPAPPGLRLARGDRRRCRRRSRSWSPAGGGRGRPGHRQRPGRHRARRGGRASTRSALRSGCDRAWAINAGLLPERRRRGARRPCSADSDAGRRRPRGRRGGRSSSASASRSGAAVTRGRRERAWELEAIGVATPGRGLAAGGRPGGCGVARVVAPDQRDRVLEPELGDRQVLGQVRPVGRSDRAANLRRWRSTRRVRRRHRPGSAWR